MAHLSLLNTINCEQNGVRAVRFMAHDDNCLTCGTNKTIKLWHPLRGRPLKIYQGHENAVLDVAGSKGRFLMISASEDKTSILWDVERGQIIRRYTYHTDSVLCVKFNKESTLVASGSADRALAFFDLRCNTKEPSYVCKNALDTITSVQILGNEVLTTSVDHYARLYDFRMGEMLPRNAGAFITYGNFTKDGEHYILSCADNTMKLYNKVTGAIEKIYSGFQSKQFLIENAIGKRNTHVFTGSATGEILCFDIRTGVCTQKMIHTRNIPVTSLSNHPRKRFLLSASRDEIKLWGQQIPTQDQNETQDKKPS